MADFRGRVTRVDDAGNAWVAVAAFGATQEIGPCESLLGLVPVVGARVLLAEITPADLVVVGLLPTGTPGPPPTPVPEPEVETGSAGFGTSSFGMTRFGG
jgi:hypothetical protein